MVRRFPLIILDEAQDTGYFLGKAIMRLLSPSVRGVVVGDPDQAIFEFNGAEPDLFNAFEAIEGAHILPLWRSRRCPPAVARACSFLKDSGGQIDPATENSGRALPNPREGDVLRGLTHRAMTEGRLSGSVKVLARRNTTVDLLMGRQVKDLPKLRCPALTHMTRAVQAFRQGKQVSALASAKAGVELILFGHEGASDLDIQGRGTEPKEWKLFVVECLLLANSLPTSRKPVRLAGRPRHSTRRNALSALPSQFHRIRKRQAGAAKERKEQSLG